MIQNLIFSIQQVAPVFIIVFLGVFLKKRGLINDNFVSVASKIVFNIALPSLCFMEIAKTDFVTVFQGRLILFALLATLVVFAVSWALAIPLLKEGCSRGSFIQGAFRSNYAIIGFAVVLNMFGRTGLAKAAILLAFVMPLYNVLAVIALTVPRHGATGYSAIIRGIAANPLILATLLALPFSIFRIPMHKSFVTTVTYFSSLTLPLALLGIGGSLDFNTARARLRPAIIASAIKIAVTPLVFTPLAFYLGFSGQDLGVLFILFACPTAIASFIMARAMDCDSVLAAQIVLVSTLCSVVTLSLGIFALKSAGLL